MRVLFVNEIEGSTVTSVNGSLNYPPDSIYHVFLRKRFKSTIDEDTLTIDLDEAVNMDCFFMGFHNVTAGTVSFLDGTLTPVGTPIDLTAASDIFVSYFSTISVKRIVVDIEATDDQVYIGGIGAGMYEQMPDTSGILAGFAFEVVDATAISRSPGGQTSRNKAPTLRRRTFTWPAITQAEKDEIDPLLVTLGIGKPVFIDLFEGAPEFDPPIYAEVAEPRKLERPSALIYALTITLEESR